MSKIPELNHLLDCLSNFCVQSCPSMNNLCSVAQKEGANLHLLSGEALPDPLGSLADSGTPRLSSIFRCVVAIGCP